MNQKGLIGPILIIIALIIGIIVSLQLIRQTNIFKSKASSEVITFSGANVKTGENGSQYTVGPEVTVELLSPFGGPPAKVLGTQKAPFWEEFFNTFLISLHLKKDPNEQPKETIDISNLPLAKKLAPSDNLSPGSQANFSTPVPATPVPVTASVKPSSTTSTSILEATVGFKIAESPTDLANKQFLVYRNHPTTIHYTFLTNTAGVKTLFVEFQSEKGQSSQVFSKSIGLRAAAATSAPASTTVTSPSPTPIESSGPTPSPIPVSSSNPTPNPSPSPTPIPSSSSEVGGVGL